MGIGSLLGLPVVEKVVDKFIPDANQKAEFKHELDMAVLADNAEGRKVLQAMLGNNNWFVSGAIPAVIWLCPIMLFNNYVLLPWAQVFGATNMPEVMMPDGYFGLLGTIIMGLFGKKLFDGNDIKWGSFHSPKK